MRTVNPVDVELADVVAVVLDEPVVGPVAVPAEVDGQVPEQRRRRPESGEHGGDAAHGHASLVAERVGDGHVAVDADAAEVQQRRRAEQHIVGVEQVANDRPERPTTGHLQSVLLPRFKTRISPVAWWGSGDGVGLVIERS